MRAWTRTRQAGRATFRAFNLSNPGPTGIDVSTTRHRGPWLDWRPQKATVALLDQVRAVLDEYWEYLPLTCPTGVLPAGRGLPVREDRKGLHATPGGTRERAPCRDHRLRRHPGRWRHRRPTLRFPRQGGVPRNDRRDRR